MLNFYLETAPMPQNIERKRWQGCYTGFQYEKCHKTRYYISFKTYSLVPGAKFRYPYSIQYFSKVFIYLSRTKGLLCLCSMYNINSVIHNYGNWDTFSVRAVASFSVILTQTNFDNKLDSDDLSVTLSNIERFLNSASVEADPPDFITFQFSG